MRAYAGVLVMALLVAGVCAAPDQEPVESSKSLLHSAVISVAQLFEAPPPEARATVEHGSESIAPGNVQTEHLARLHKAWMKGGDAQALLSSKDADSANLSAAPLKPMRRLQQLPQAPLSAQASLQASLQAQAQAQALAAAQAQAQAQAQARAG